MSQKKISSEILVVEKISRNKNSEIKKIMRKILTERNLSNGRNKKIYIKKTRLLFFLKKIV